MWSAAEEVVVKGLIGYEVAAFVSRGRLPTITSVARSHPVVGALLVAGLAWHFRAADTIPRSLVP